MWETYPKLTQKSHFSIFFPIFPKLFIRFERSFVHSFYTILWSFRCNFIKLVLLGCEKHIQNSPKNGQKSHFLIFFRFSQNCSYDSNEILYSHSTPYYGPLGVISWKSYCWDVRNISKINPKMAKKVIFRFFSDFPKTVHTIRTKFCTVILHHIMVL